MPDLTYRTAYELAELIRDREVSAEEVLGAHLNRIAEFNPTLNAIVTLQKGPFDSSIGDFSLSVPSRPSRTKITMSSNLEAYRRNSAWCPTG
ncbi:MAG: hypothetical protein JRF59_14035 [Deltaproteobacteria bacterium]|nr:hypothetical protein [Deltaproteobacteria bacterium]